MPGQFLMGHLEQLASSASHVPATVAHLVPVEHAVARVNLPAGTGIEIVLASTPEPVKQFGTPTYIPPPTGQ